MSLRTTLSTGLFALITVLAFAGTASASTLTSPEGTTYTGEIVATSTNSELDRAFVTTKCGHSETKGKVESHGPGANATIVFSSLTFTECNYRTTVQKPGIWEITSSNTVISNGMEFTMDTSVGSCTFSTSNTSIGPLTEGANASLDINSPNLPKTGGNFLCGSSMTWTGSYDFTTPNDLWVD